MSKITLAHGGGGSLQNELIRKEILSRFSNPLLDSLPDGALTPEGLVISSDSFVITPRFFKGGDIGKLAVTGTVNYLQSDYRGRFGNSGAGKNS